MINNKKYLIRPEHCSPANLVSSSNKSSTIIDIKLERLN